MQGLKVAGMKPVATGAEKLEDRLVHEDDQILLKASNVVLEQKQRNPYLFTPACSPHIAAMEANKPILLDKILESYNLCKAATDYLVVEGVGGWKAPLNSSYSVADLALRLGLPVILVVGVKLGCLNHAILTADAIKASELSFLGWVANILDPLMHDPSGNISYLESRIDSPLLMRFDGSGDSNRDIDETVNFAKQFLKVSV
jgi:dethiobiotin synthetase